MSSLDEFVAASSFAPDPYQLEAFAAIRAGESVLVTAPTGSGKTFVAEAAVHLALALGERAFYTTPLKALSNQKFADFRRVHGEGEVGLLTGDNSINGGAPVVVMTTEVLRNMIYADSAALDGLGVVILDEVHYLQDPFRGMVWEEIIIHLPAGIPIVALSATISNPGEFAEWLTVRRGPTRLVKEEHRPVPLESLYLLKDRTRNEPLQLLPVFAGSPARANPQIERMFRQGRRRHSRFNTPRRWEVAEVLDHEGLLPAIYFVFSRAGCDAAAEHVVAGGRRFNDQADAEEIASVAAARTAHVADRDLDALGYGHWLSILQAGVAAHHAGLVPAFKEAVEELFLRGLVRLVFATETLSLGINMPARTVVLESLSKFTGEGHELLRPGDYTQLTGRAGRRGIDSLGTAVVLYSRYVQFSRVAAIAAAGSHPLASSFRPNYNMAVNLVANYTRPQAEELIVASFGEFRQQRSREHAVRRVAEVAEELATYRAKAACGRGDIWAFLAGGEAAAATHGSLMRAFARELSAGDVLQEPEGERTVMLARGLGSNPRLLLLSDTGDLRRVAPSALDGTISRVGTIDLPEPFRPRDAEYQRAVVSLLRGWLPDGEAELAAYEEKPPPADPVAGCPHLNEHRGWARRADRLERDLARLEARVATSESGLLPHFRATLRLLEGRGYLQGWSATPAGSRLRVVYNERALLVAECAHRGLFAGLSAAELAAVASIFVFDPRSEIVIGRWPNRRLHERWNAIALVAEDLAAEEMDHSLPATPHPEPGFAEAAYYWASGVDLDDLLEDDGLAAGDFVRTCRQLIDLLLQLRDGFSDLTEVGTAAVAAIDRGVVAAGGAV